MLIAFAGLLLVGIVSMTFVLLDHKRSPPHPFEITIRNEKLDAAWRRVGDAVRRMRFGSALLRAIQAFWAEYRNLKVTSDMGKLDLALIWGGVRLALALVSIDLLVLLVRIMDWAKLR